MRPPRSDLGTVLLHWAVVAAVAVLMLTGLQIASDDPRLRFLEPVRFVFAHRNVWQLHVWAGLALFGIGVAYVTYVAKAGILARIKFDRVRRAGIFGNARSRWGTINVLVHWMLLVALLIVMATGVLLYLGFGGLVVDVHLAGAAGILGLTLLHVCTHLAYGGMAQLLRILRPTTHLPTPTPNLIELLATAVKEQDRRDVQHDATPRSAGTRRSLAPTVHAHPLVSAIAAGLAAAALAAAIDRGAEDELMMAQIAASQAPTLDGDTSDVAWRHAIPVRVRTLHGANLDGTGSSSVEIRAVHDGTNAYIAVTWDDPTRSLKHLPLAKRADGWHLLQTVYDMDDESAYYEDSIAIMLSRETVPGGGAGIFGPRNLPDRTQAAAPQRREVGSTSTLVDVWQWKAIRGGLAGFVDDMLVGGPADTGGDTLTLRPDAGRAPFATNFKAEGAGGYRGAVTPLRLPKDLASTTRALMRVDLDPEHSEQDGARWWLTNEDSVPYASALDQKIPIGTVIPGIILSGTFDGDRGDVRCGARWAAGRWTLKISRRLSTGSGSDIALSSGVLLWVAVFDHTQSRHTRHLRPIRLEVKA
jgi:cytochrome b subunit of formate dehydrogenase